MSSWTSRTSRNRFLVALLLGGSGAVVLTRLRRYLHEVRKEQRALADGASPAGAPSNVVAARQSLPAVDAQFVRRLLAILRVCIPSFTSHEALLVLFQGLLLGSRTIISDKIAALEGLCAENVTALNWPGFRYCLLAFALHAVPAAVVNSGLKAMQHTLALAFRKRLTMHLHALYMTHRAYYSASALGGLEHADQRLTDDVEKFCETLSELYSRTLKPLFDLFVFSRSLSRIIGYKGQAVLYAYFVVIGAFLRRVSPPLARMTAQYSSLSGAFRAAHSRVSASAEEVAFHDPPAGRAEMRSLNRRLSNMIRHSRLTAVQRFMQQCLDGYLVKYTASIIGLTVHAAPLYYAPPTNTDTNVLAGQYINSMRLMMQSSSAMGELVLVYKRIHSLAGHTARVSELVEQVRELGKPQGHAHAFRMAQNRVRWAAGVQKRDRRSSAKANGATSPVSNGPSDSISALAAISPATRKCGPSIQLERVSMWSPDGSRLVRDLDVSVPCGTSVIILGPNGSGKSSILRMLGGLWPLQAGTVTLPPRDELFFLAQRSYMYSGSLAEQLMYPNLPGVVVGESIQFDEALARDVLMKVELIGLMARCGGFHGAMNWDTLSGGERARLCCGRLLYHRPKYAILDEVTAAVSADGEVVLYRAMSEAGITLLSVAHRKAVMQFHQAAIILDGVGNWEFKKLDGVEDAS